MVLRGHTCRQTGGAFLLLLVSVLSKAFLALVRRHLVFLSFLSARHISFLNFESRVMRLIIDYFILNLSDKNPQ